MPNSIDRIDGPVYCRELNTGNSLTGTVEINENRIETLIYNFEECFFIKGDDPIHLRSASNHIISLYGNSTGGPGETARLTEPKRITYCQRIASNLAVSGPDEWRTSDLIKRASFTIPRADHVLRHNSKRKKLTRPRQATEDDFLLYTVSTDDLTASVWHQVEGWEHAHNFTMIVDLEFHTPRTIYSYLDDVLSYVQLLSFCTALPLTPTNIKISRASRASQLQAIQANQNVEDHSVQYIFRVDDAQEEHSRPRGSPLLAWNDFELAALQSSTQRWMARRAVWTKAYHAMAASLAYRNEISSERLMAAWRWFEEIPTCKSRRALTDKDIKSISEAAQRKASELQLGDFTHRIQGAIKQLKSESRREQFSRLTELTRERFGHNPVLDRMVTDLCRASDFRGQAAHGHLTWQGDAELRAFYRATCAMEAVCYLMTAVDLSFCDEGLSRVWCNPLAQGYFLAH